MTIPVYIAEAMGLPEGQRGVLVADVVDGGPADEAGLLDNDQEVEIDGFEVGIPYADPLMDGPVIAAAGRSAIESGMTISGAIRIINGVVAATGKPVIAMTYTNPVLRVGIDRFVGLIAQAGASGLILADLPAEEASPYLDAAAGHEIAMALFVAPTTDEERLRMIIAEAPAFLYGVATLGVTGERDVLAATAAALSARVRAVTDIPLVLGVGISTPEQAADAGELGDGVIVGSALVRAVIEAGGPDEARSALGSATQALAAALRA